MTDDLDELVELKRKLERFGDAELKLLGLERIKGRRNDGGNDGSGGGNSEPPKRRKRTGGSIPPPAKTRATQPRTKFAFSVREAILKHVPELRSTWLSKAELIEAVQAELPEAKAPTIRTEIHRRIREGDLREDAHGRTRMK